jgi:gluconokinase
MNVVVVMGVSGAGKSTVGAHLALRQGWSFEDADDLHPEANRRKMAAGVALTDQDRVPWLDRVHEVILDHERNGTSAVIACSALKESYRRRLLADTVHTRFAYLRVAPAELERRLRERRAHFFDPRLLTSQLTTLEEPSPEATVNGNADVEQVVDAIVERLGL